MTTGNISCSTLNVSGTSTLGAISSVTSLGLVDASGAGAGQVKFPATQNSSSNVNTLDDYDEYTAANTACTGALTTSVVWKLAKIGNHVTLTLPATGGTCSATAQFTYGIALPAKYRPTSPISMPINVQDNSARSTSLGMIYIDATSGSILIYRSVDSTTNFTAATGGTQEAKTISWTI